MNKDEPKPITPSLPRGIEGGVEPASVIRVPPTPPKQVKPGAGPDHPQMSKKESPPNPPTRPLRKGVEPARKIPAPPPPPQPSKKK
jgi:hypothetical protein